MRQMQTSTYGVYATFIFEKLNIYFKNYIKFVPFKHQIAQLSFKKEYRIFTCYYERLVNYNDKTNV